MQYITAFNAAAVRKQKPTDTNQQPLTIMVTNIISWDGHYLTLFLTIIDNDQPFSERLCWS